MVMIRSKEKEAIVEYLKNEIGYFLKLSDIAKEMNEWANSRKNPKIIQTVMCNRLKKLKRWEKREKWWASTGGLMHKYKKLSESPHGYFLKERFIGERIAELLPKMGIFEKKLWLDTDEKLKQEIKNKSAMQINMVKVREISAEIIKDINAYLATSREMLHLLVQD